MNGANTVFGVIRAGIFHALALLAGGLLITQGQADTVELVSGGKALPIVVSPDAGRAAEFAAGELATYLARISGSRPARLTHAQADRDHILIRVMSSTSVPAGSYRIQASDGILVLEGTAPEGLLFAVYGFLEDYLGVHWFRPGEDGCVLPERRRKLTVDVGRAQLQQPAFGIRWFGYGQAERVSMDLLLATWDWCLKNRLNGLFKIGRNLEAEKAAAQREFLEKRGYAGDRMILPGRLIEPDTVGKNHPEYFPLMDGKRKVRAKAHYCYTNPNVVEMQADQLRTHFSRYPRAEFFSLSHTWWPRWCMCPECLEATGKRQNYYGYIRTDYWLDFVETVLARIENEFRTHRLYVPVRVNTLPAPVRSERLNDRVYIAIQDPFSQASSPRDPESSWGQRMQTNLRRWSTATENLIIEDWLTCQGSLLAPVEVPKAESYRALAARDGVCGVRLTKMVNWGAQAPVYWMAARLLWNPDANLESLKETYYANWFGPAAAPVRRMRERLADAIANHPADAGRMQMPAYLADLLRDLDTAAIERDRKKALRLAAGTSCEDRVKTFDLALNYTRLAGRLLSRGVYTVKQTPNKMVLQPSGVVAELRAIKEDVLDAGIVPPSRTGWNYLRLAKLDVSEPITWNVHAIVGDGWQARILPDFGGHVFSFLDSDGRDYFHHRPFTARSLAKGGIGGFHDGAGRWRRDTYANPYETREASSRRLVLEATGKNGLRIVKTFRPDRKWLVMETRLENPTAKPVQTGYAAQMYPAVGGKVQGDRIVSFTAQGPRRVDVFDSTGSMKTYGEDLRPESTWAAVDETATHGLVWRVDTRENVSSYETWDSFRVYTMEVLGRRRTLQPGDSYTFCHRLSLQPAGWRP